MDDAHFKSIEIAVLSVGVEGPKNSFVPHADELNNAFFQALGKSWVCGHHLNKLNNLIFLFDVVAVVEGWAVRV